MGLEVLGLLLVHVFELTDQLGIEFVFVVSDEHITSCLQSLEAAFEALLLVAVLNEESRLGVVLQ